MTLNIYTRVTKQLRVGKFRGLVLTSVEVTWENLVGRFSPKNQNCQSERKTGTSTNVNMQNSMVEKPFPGKFCTKIQKYLFKVKFDTNTNSNTQNSLDQKYSFWATLFGQNWSKKSKLSVLAKNWQKNQFEYEKLNADIYFSCFQLKVSFFQRFIP